MTLARLAEDGLDKYGEYVALAFEGRQYTNLDQQRSASRLAHALRRLGVMPGDRVVVMLPNCPEVIQSYGAILKCGAVIVPVIFLLGDKEVAHILVDSEARRSTLCLNLFLALALVTLFVLALDFETIWNGQRPIGFMHPNALGGIAGSTLVLLLTCRFFWSWPWTPTVAGRYTLVARATDGTGEVQTSKRQGTVPNGSTGYHEVMIPAQ